MAVTTGKTTTQSSNLGIKGSGTGAGGMFGGTSTSNSNSRPSSSAPGTNKSGPGATGGAKTANKPSTPSTTAKKDAPKAPAAPAKAPAKPSTSNSQAPRGPAASLAAAKSSLKTAPATVNAQAQLASDRLGSQKPAPRPQSIQGMINNPVTLSGKAYDGINARFAPSLPDQNAKLGANALKAVRPGGWETQFNNAAGVPVVNFGGSFALGGIRQNLSPSGQNLYNAIVDNAYRNNQPTTIFSGKRFSGSPNHDPGYAIDAYIRDPKTGVPVGKGALDKMGLGAAATFPIGSRSKTLGTTAAEAKKIQGVLRGPYQQWSNNLFDTVYSSPGMYGTTRETLRYGGPFYGERADVPNAADYMHHDVTPNRAQQSYHTAAAKRWDGRFVSSDILTRLAEAPQPPPAVSPPSMARNSPIPRPVPRPMQPSTYSGYGTFNPPVAPKSPAVPSPVAPRPSQNMTPPPGWQPPAKPPQAFVATDPRVNIPPSGYPQPGNIPAGYFQQFEMTPDDMEGLKQQAMKDFSFRELMEMRKNQQMLPGFMGPITRDVERTQTQVARPPMPTPRPERTVAGMSFTPGLPGQMPLSQNMTPPPGWQPPARETLGAPETYIDPSTGIARNPFDTQRGIPGAGMSFTPGLPGPMPPSLPSPGGMSFTPGLPGPQKQFYDRVPQTPGPMPQPQLPDYPGKTPAGTFTTPYDVKPQPFREFANPGLPPGYSDRYFSPGDKGISKPANPYQAPQEQEVSENPIQGPSNPSQEPEDPQAVKERRKKSAETGATIGTVIAGPVGGLIGWLLGDQMGKTKPGQRKAIANNPHALSANVQSINLMAERGGGGNQRQQGLYVTEAGFRDVLVQPKKVLKQPENYTSLEQMLAALAEGKDPETGKTL